MSSLALNPLMPKLMPRPALVERTHFSGPSATIHHSHSSSKGGKHSVALSALTLLSFLFFLNILQNCLQEHMQSMNTTQPVIIVQARTPEAEKRKGETDMINTSLLTESREIERLMTKIPVKLRTHDSSRP